MLGRTLPWFPSSGKEDADKVALLTYLQELEAENENLLAHRAGSQELHLDTLISLRVEK